MNGLDGDAFPYATVDGDEITCEFKRLTHVADKAPLDFWLDPALPVGFLPKA